jgi:hypothetical protein
MFEDFDLFLENYSPGMRPRRIPGILYRKGGDATDWATPGSQVYVPVAEYVQAGAIQWVGGPATEGLATYAFPRGYYGEPLLFVQVMSSNPPAAAITTRAGSAGDAVEIYWRSDVPVSSINFSWLAYSGQLQKSA